MRSFTCFLWILTLTAGCVLEDQPVGDAGICGSCPTPRPVCHEETEMCVECTMENSAKCAAEAPVCDPETFECVGCVASSDCNDADEARCDTDANECVGCEGMADCEGITGLPACNNGTCVECTPETEDSDCEGTSCNPATLTCTNTMLASRQTCQTCVSDSECGEDGSASEEHRCVEMFCPMGVKFCPVGERFPDGETGFCLKVYAPGECEQPYAIRMSDRESLSGDPLESYCGINETLATCPAVRDLDRLESCPGGEDIECSTSGLCLDVGGLPDQCTYRCEDEQSDVECVDSPPGRPGSTCGSSGGSVKYCGGG